MSKQLHISDDLSLPDDILASTQAILAMKGAGKTYAAMKMMEQATLAGHQTVAIDPTGVWWGVSADGAGKGLPVLVMGGEHGNVPLESTSGEVVAEFIVDSGRSVVLDLSLMRKAEMHRFMAAFLDRLYHYKATHRENLHVFFDEADTAAPQQPGPEQTRVLGAAEDVVRRGRSRGLGMTMITQRPAVLNKNLLEMCDTLYVMRVVGNLDQEAVRKRVRVDADDAAVEKMMGSLASLDNGEAWVWSPAALGIFKRIKFAKRQTFDSGRSPKPGERQQQPKGRADIDLADLTARIRATVEKAKENDPKALRAEVAKLRKELDAKPAPAKVETKTERVEVPVLADKHVKSLETIADKLTGEGRKLVETGEKMLAEASAVRQTITSATARMAGANAAPARPVLPSVQAVSYAKNYPGRGERRAVAPRPPGDKSPLGNSGKRRLMVALAEYPTGLTDTRLSLLTGISKSGGTWRTYVGELRGNGWIDGDRSCLRITPAGLEALGDYEPLPTGEALIDYWRGRLGNSGKRAMFDAAVEAFPAALTYEQMAAKTGIEPSGGTWRTYLGELRGLELLTGKGEIRASEDLFATA